MRSLIPSMLCMVLLSAGQAWAKPVDLLCERHQRVSISGDVGLDSAIELTWRGKPYRMQRVGTSTGANRFEDPVSGLIWVSIPSKAMLLDGRRREPVVNECRAGMGRRVR